ncbi:MAG TPA: ASPIC/UnbV domain-containing protein, partial [Thermoanaerobaculia bacterium]
DVLVVRDGGPPLLFRNSVAPRGAPRVRVLLRGRPGNPNGLGARLELAVAGRTQVRHVLANRGYLSASEPAATFGLGPAAEAELSVAWPGGPRRTYRGVPVDREVVVFDESPGSGAGG